MKPHRIILDVDVGSDDFLAIMLFLKAETLGQVKIEAIICTSGNTTVEHVSRNVVRLLETADRTDIPVYKGSRKQLIPPRQDIKMFHGCDGFGELKHNFEPNMEIIGQKPGAIAMREIVVSNPKQVSLICLAPLTNVALAVKLYDDFVDNVKDLWIMGGNYTAVGNVTATAEYNFFFDPEAAFIVLDTVTCPIHILTWETCLYPKITFDWRYNTFGKLNNPLIELLNKAEKSIYCCFDESNWLPCDAFLAAAFLYPSRIIVKQSVHHASVELHGFQTRGQIVLDHLKSKQPNVTIIEKINENVFKDILLEL